jgi:uncharacterized protein YxeA
MKTILMILAIIVLFIFGNFLLKDKPNLELNTQQEYNKIEDEPEIKNNPCYNAEGIEVVCKG